MRTVKLVAVAVPMIVAAWLLFGHGSGSQLGPSEQATALEATLMAPCCFKQTLDAHDSELATQLRGEIEKRLQQGESTTAIRDDLIRRYGARISAAPPGGAFSEVLLLATGIAGVGYLAYRVRGRQRIPQEQKRSPREQPSSRDEYSRDEYSRDEEEEHSSVARDEYDERLDAELRALGPSDTKTS